MIDNENVVSIHMTYPGQDIEVCNWINENIYNNSTLKMEMVKFRVYVGDTVCYGFRKGDDLVEFKLRWL